MYTALISIISHTEFLQSGTPYRVILMVIYEPCHEKTCFLYMKTKTVTPQLISAFVFATEVVQSLYFLNPKCQASCYLLWMHSLVCVRPGREPRTGFLAMRLT